MPALLLFALGLTACADPGAAAAADPSATADVEAVAVSGEEGAYTFDVTVRSPDRDCSQYADWWEVLSEDGALLYRRVLNHSHPDEQPFTRSGSPVPVAGDQVVIVRAHMNPGGYGGAAMKGTASGGLRAAAIAVDFAADAATRAPLPEACWY